MITIARIDERLIHGQVAYAWTVAYKSEAIMVIDNEIAKDKFQISLLQICLLYTSRLAAIYELEQKKKQEQLAKAQKSAKAVTGFVGNVILWVLTVFFGLFAILCVCLLYTSQAVGIVTELLGNSYFPVNWAMV